MNLQLKSLLVSSMLVSLAFISCQKETQQQQPPLLSNNDHGHQPAEPGFVENDMVMYWNDKVETVLSVAMNQPTRSRYFAIIEIAVHDALNNIKPKYQRYALETRQQFASPDAAVASAAYWAIKGLNRQGSFPIDTWYNESLATIPDGESKELGKTLGKDAADAIIANRANDGFTQVLSNSANPPDGTSPGAYRHTNLLNLRYVPNWGTVMKPYVVETTSQFRQSGPYAVTSPEYAADYNEVKEKGARVGSTRTDNESMIAKFWGENRPSIIWNEFARRIIETKHLDAWKTARLFALMHVALADGVTSALESNYFFYSWRPVTAIHEGNNDNNEATTADASWIENEVESPNPNPAAYFVSPPLPEYPAPQAVMGGSVGQVLQSFFGSDDISVDLTSFNLPGTTIHYNSIAQAVRDNSMSKMYSGWNFRKSVLDGEAQGKQIANYVFSHQFGDN